MRNFESRINNFFSILTLEIGAIFSKSPERTFWKFEIFSGEPRGILTSAGEKSVTGVVQGAGRVADVYQHQDGSLEVTFAHGKFSTLLADGVVSHDWIPAGEGAAPLIYGPSEKTVRDFCKSSFTILLLPVFEKGRWAAPVLKPRDLVSYKILTTDQEGREGVAVEIAPAVFH
ncbi:MAG: hypothetical protein Q8J72_10210 [Rhodocyclaceae bacterium]|nr:hypothetical protein [Rhodocyclaceae bacterium]